VLDILFSLRNYLIVQDPIDFLAGDRIYAGPFLPREYIPEQGPALLFSIRGGGQDYSSQVLNPSIQFRSYALNLEEAMGLDRALYDSLNDRCCCEEIKMARLETLGQPLHESQTGWPYVLSFWRILFNNFTI
jgi:hypothetical protein